MTEVGVESLGDRVTLVELRRPPNNFFDEDLLTQIADAVLELDDDPTVSVILLGSEGKHFCAGADLRDTSAASIRRVYRQAYRLFSGRKPVVAAIQGAAVGGGLGLALAADFRVVGPSSRLTANFARIGFHQGFGLSATLPAIVGRQRALDLLYTGRSVMGAEAVEIGLADELSDDVRSTALSFARRIAGSAPLSLVAIRSTMRRQLRADVATALDLEAAAQAALLGTHDFAEGVAAAVAKRSPEFDGS
ncbi:enoyl-CoA hydratase/isomerase family protein [Cnuibacter physcomitrellae]|uniref:enoyl-CoA hydratase/isomerase family protein n=1 Tax=Cnuibacter physcomitrellae TaxID=1619308 RepID=UPI002175C324|nr:enoyl-CoA hydratase/isomerase family protein [Cnuibacter physcomitrellae]MCS5498321.1 enoyl-CoA hydratase/isomerase family protein [Cnuibacter physcomitrellae]